MLASEILSKAADLVEPKGAWYQGDFAANAEGDLVEPEDPDACRWCAAGAIHAIVDEMEPIAVEAKRYLWQVLALPLDKDHLYERPIGVWNDNVHRQQSEVVSALRQAASLAKYRESAP